MTNKKAKGHYISKSGYIRGLQCHKSLYLHVNNPELKTEPSDSQQAAFETGEEVGRIAHGLFPGGLEIIFEEDQPLSIQVEKTKAAIKEGAKVIYEAAFGHSGVFCKVDILKKAGSKWEIYEVKSSTEVASQHYDDVTFQFFVLTRAGLEVSKAHLVHINNQYVRNGDLEPENLFDIVDVTAEVNDRKSRVPENLEKIRNMLDGGVPNIQVGSYCDKPHRCDFFDHCWQGREGSQVFALKGGGKLGAMELFQKGIVTFDQIRQEGISLPPRKQFQLDSHFEKRFAVDGGPVREFLSQIRYPLYFLDFETFMSAIPPYDGTWPYQQIPFQYSLHWQDHEGGPLGHDGFLALPKTDPRKELLEKLLEKLRNCACVIVYNKRFENMVLRNLACSFPERREEIEAVQGKLLDLMVPFQRRFVYHWQMEGSYSLKAVIPALAPDCGYEDLEIQDGGEAMGAYARMCAANDPAELNKIRDDLLSYCKRDTLATAVLLDKLRELAAATGPRMSPENTKKLFERFPFFWDRLRLSCGDGWFPLLWDLCLNIEAELEKEPNSGLYVHTIKEKYGSLRFYVGGIGSERIYGLITDAERQSETTCEICGATGSSIFDNDFRTVNRCERCRQVP